MRALLSSLTRVHLDSSEMESEGGLEERLACRFFLRLYFAMIKL